MVFDNVILKTVASIGFILLLSSCISLDNFVKEDQNSESYSTQEVGRLLTEVTEGTIVSIKPVKLSGGTALGTTLGAVRGDLAGASASTTDKKSNQETVGALAGAILGSTVEAFSTEDTGYEFLIENHSGIRAFVDTTKQDLQVGDVVYIIQGSGPIRISKK